MKVWVTKYALTSKGILELEGRVSEEFPYEFTEDGVSRPRHFFKSDFHRTKEEAVKRAEEMRRRRIEWLYREIARIRALEFK